MKRGVEKREAEWKGCGWCSQHLRKKLNELRSKWESPAGKARLDAVRFPSSRLLFFRPSSQIELTGLFLSSAVSPSVGSDAVRLLLVSFASLRRERVSVLDFASFFHDPAALRLRFLLLLSDSRRQLHLLNM